MKYTTMTKTKYIIRKNEPFCGMCVNTIHNGYVDYMDEPTTFEQYQEQHQDELVVINEDQMIDKINEYKQSLITGFAEISKEQYHEMMNVLPPLYFTNYSNFQVFVMREYTYSTITECFVWVKSTGKYYSSMIDTSKGHKSMLDRISNELSI